eukprot:m.252032 g.252032  ORF g.252032 m.252032 type:complete len:227 (+) comp40344_c0_seq4:574-1254(+)
MSRIIPQESSFAVISPQLRHTMSTIAKRGKKRRGRRRSGGTGAAEWMGRPLVPEVKLTVGGIVATIPAYSAKTEAGREGLCDLIGKMMVTRKKVHSKGNGKKTAVSSLPPPPQSSVSCHERESFPAPPFSTPYPPPPPFFWPPQPPFPIASPCLPHPSFVYPPTYFNHPQPSPTYRCHDYSSARPSSVRPSRTSIQESSISNEHQESHMDTNHVISQEEEDKLLDY